MRNIDNPSDALEVIKNLNDIHVNVTDEKLIMNIAMVKNGDIAEEYDLPRNVIGMRFEHRGHNNIVMTYMVTNFRTSKIKCPIVAHCITPNMYKHQEKSFRPSQILFKISQYNK
jgi:hypothetical protein